MSKFSGDRIFYHQPKKERSPFLNLTEKSDRITKNNPIALFPINIKRTICLRHATRTHFLNLVEKSDTQENTLRDRS